MKAHLLFWPQQNGLLFVATVERRNTRGDLIKTFFSAIDNEAKKMYGVQFHPEVDLTKGGAQMFKNFLFKVRCWSFCPLFHHRGIVEFKYMVIHRRCAVLVIILCVKAFVCQIKFSSFVTDNRSENI